MKISENTKKFLEYVALAGIITIAATSPYFLINIARAYLKEKDSRFDKREARAIAQTIASARRSHLIDISLQGKVYRAMLSTRGKKRLSEMQFHDLQIPKQKRWDGKWRIVIFDIPKTAPKTKRNIFTAKLKSLGFCLIQKSVWAYPYPCEKEIQLVTQTLEISQFVSLIVADSLSNETELRRYFRL